MYLKAFITNTSEFTNVILILFGSTKISKASMFEQNKSSVRISEGCQYVIDMLLIVGKEWNVSPN